jgi:SAM-dependent methyltransferase
MGIVKKDIISNKYINDGYSKVSLNSVQNKYKESFINDSRIQYNIIDKCHLCGSKDFTVIAEKGRHGIPLDTAVCYVCGLVFTVNQMTEKSIEIFYSEYYRKIYDVDVKKDWKNIDNRYSANGRISKFVKQSDVVVEIGAGGGWNLFRYKTAGIEHYGFDFDDEYIDYGKKKYGISLYRGGIDKAKELGIKADYVILSHIVEHLNNPVDYLMDLKKILKPLARVVITVPCLNYMLTRGARYDFLGYLQNAHSYSFDEYTLRYLGMKANYKIVCGLGGYIMIQNTNKKNDLFCKFEKKQKIRGPKIIRYLKICEQLLGIKTVLIPKKIEFIFEYLDFLLKPFKLIRAIMVTRLGIK